MDGTSVVFRSPRVSDGCKNSPSTSHCSAAILPQVGSAFYDFKAREHDELSLQRGSVVEILGDCGQGWKMARVGKQTGMIPENYVRLIGTQPDVIEFNELEISTDRVGDGSFSNVFRGKYRGMDVAVKVPKTKKSAPIDSSILEVIKQEALIYSRLKHPNVVGFVGVCIREPCLVLELCNGGTLFNIYRRLSYSTPSIVMAWSMQIAQGMEHLHNRDQALLHADLKADNVLVKEAPCLCDHADPPIYRQFRSGRCTECGNTALEKLTLKITDFGLSRLETSTRKSIQGSAPWMSPELIVNGVYSRASDVWSFGILLWEITANHLPMTEFHRELVLHAIAEEHITPAIPEECPSSIANVMQKCWAVEAKNRPSFTEIIEMLHIARRNIDPEKNRVKSVKGVHPRKRFETVGLEALREKLADRYAVINFRRLLPPPVPAKSRQADHSANGRHVNNRITKDSIGLPQGFEHKWSVISSGANPSDSKFYVLSGSSGQHENENNFPQSPDPQNSTLPRNHRLKTNASSTEDSEHMFRFGPTLKNSKSNPELADCVDDHSISRSNAQRYRRCETARNENLGVVDVVDVKCGKVSNRRNHDSSLSSQSVNSNPDKPANKKHSGGENKLRKYMKKLFVSPDSTSDDNKKSDNSRICDRPSVSTAVCYHPHHSENARYSHNCAFDLRTPLEELRCQKEIAWASSTPINDDMVMYAKKYIPKNSHSKTPIIPKAEHRRIPKVSQPIVNYRSPSTQPSPIVTPSQPPDLGWPLEMSEDGGLAPIINGSYISTHDSLYGLRLASAPDPTSECTTPVTEPETHHTHSDGDLNRLDVPISRKRVNSTGFVPPPDIFAPSVSSETPRRPTCLPTSLERTRHPTNERHRTRKSILDEEVRVDSRSSLSPRAYETLIGRPGQSDSEPSLPPPFPSRNAPPPPTVNIHNNPVPKQIPFVQRSNNNIM